MEHVEVALQTSVFAGRAVNGDIGKVEGHLAAVELKAEVVAVDGHCGSVGQLHVPVESVHLYDIECVLLLVDKGVNALCTTQGNMKFGGIASAYDGNCTFHSKFLLLM